VLLSWSVRPDRWLRRASIIAQLGARERTDTDLLATVVDANASDRDFFVRKAIGWALRDYARADPDWVSGFRGGEVGGAEPVVAPGSHQASGARTRALRRRSRRGAATAGQLVDCSCTFMSDSARCGTPPPAMRSALSIAAFQTS
jgi:DNA alkylation repair enzyme